MKSAVAMRAVAILCLMVAASASRPAGAQSGAERFAPPGDLALRHDLQHLDDAGLIRLPLNSWPLTWGDIDRSLAAVEAGEASGYALSALHRVKEKLRREQLDVAYGVSASAAHHPRVIRSFEDTPREDGQLSARLSWLTERVVLNLEASLALDPSDEDEARPDGSYIGFALGNWLFSAGWQERWWGPGRDGSLILSDNARPSPGIALQRNHSSPFQSKWLRWIGPWTLTAFMNRLDDERAIDDALLFGLRVAFEPHRSLEIGLSRTAQWCGDGRPCDFDTFTDLLLGNDNRGVNVDPDDEPGNQLAGIDMRWRLPRDIPVALYMQWIGEDTRQGGPEPGSWLRQAGIEHWGSAFGLAHRTHVEISDTICREGGFGFAGAKPDCAYEHGIYATGYRYNGRVIGHPADGDARTWSLGSTLVQSAGHSWNLTVRYMELNRVGAAPDARHTLAATPQDLADVQLSHERLTRYGRFHLGLGLRRLDDTPSGDTTTDVTGFIQWTLE